MIVINVYLYEVHLTSNKKCIYTDGYIIKDVVEKDNKYTFGKFSISKNNIRINKLSCFNDKFAIQLFDHILNKKELDKFRNEAKKLLTNK